MINAVIDWCFRNRFLTLLAVFFGILWAILAIRNTPLDALPDLSDVQVTIYTEWMGAAPGIVEDQVTYPITTAMLSAPHVKSVRGISAFGFSWVYVIFDDSTDLYWARTRVLEYLEKIKGRIPPGVAPVLAPDATGVGWVFSYALIDRSGKHSLADLRTVQDWYLKPFLESVPDVAEVATFGGFPRAYTVEVHPNKLLAYGIPLNRVVSAVRTSNQDVGAGALEASGTEYMIRGMGYIRSRDDIRNIVLGTTPTGVPVRVSDVARVSLLPDMRRGVADLNGEGDAVGGIVVMRFGKNALRVIDRVKAELEEFKQTRLPEGMEVVIAYDRSDLIKQSIRTLRRTLIEESIIVILVCLFYLFSVRSSLVIIVTLPIAVALSFIPMYYMGLTSNIMSLGGIAIAIGAMVDAAIVIIENVHKRLEHWQGDADRLKDDPEGLRALPRRDQVILDAIKEVGRPIYYALLVMTVSFLPVFTLEAQEGRLFKPLAFTKTFSMFFASLLSITLVPAIMSFLIERRVLAEHRNPISRFLIWIYTPIARFELRYRFITITVGLIAIVLAYPAYKKLGSEFMPPLFEGSFLYMPMTLPGVSVYEARRTLQIQNRVLREFPEVEVVLGKAGRATTATDPAPLAMVETFVTLKPQSQWRKGLTWETLKDEMDKKMKFPGYVNVWTMPIKNRVDMISTGIRTPLGIKVLGTDVKVIQSVAEQLERLFQEKDIKGTGSVIAERTLGGYYINLIINREAIARYGLAVGEVQSVIESLVGGTIVTTTIEGRERYPVIVRYPRELRLSADALSRVLVEFPAARSGMGAGMMRAGSGSATASTGMSAGTGGAGAMGEMAGAPQMPATADKTDAIGDAFGGANTIFSGANLSANAVSVVPLSELVTIEKALGPDMIRSERGLVTGTVYIDVKSEDIDIGTYVANAQELVKQNLTLPKGTSLVWSGQYEYLERAKQRLVLVIPLTLFIIFLLIYLNFGSVIKTLIVMLSVPFALGGSFLALSYLEFHLSVAVWVGTIALAGVAAETGVVMLVYIDEAYERRKRQGMMRSLRDLYEAIIEGAVQRVRPKMMTVSTTFLGLVPIMWSHGAGADVMQRIAAPMLGGLLTSTLLTLFVIPSLFYIWRSFEVRRLLHEQTTL
jgi:Cu(I)/Ag(I) efflux system membrane protein CusA/SilA